MNSESRRKQSSSGESLQAPNRCCCYSCWEIVNVLHRKLSILKIVNTLFLLNVQKITYCWCVKKMLVFNLLIKFRNTESKFFLYFPCLWSNRQEITLLIFKRVLIYFCSCQTFLYWTTGKYIIHSDIVHTHPFIDRYIYTYLKSVFHTGELIFSFSSEYWYCFNFTLTDMQSTVHSAIILSNFTSTNQRNIIDSTIHTYNLKITDIMEFWDNCCHVHKTLLYCLRIKWIFYA